ncbi:hypothetical protein HCH_03231 [Hahella chejuensis KCTC 2396]|uniref:Uncharacterized protein n=1 Tax=Hahella chejuensis (strain KCTC 2396) TaxID=349521 RepID=Q2SH83_HAHCH|nr:hypothetical protein HCH_03231 [Hahella chejuensis KCTC 2396]
MCMWSGLKTLYFDLVDKDDAALGFGCRKLKKIFGHSFFMSFRSVFSFEPGLDTKASPGKEIDLSASM